MQTMELYSQRLARTPQTRDRHFFCPVQGSTSWTTAHGPAFKGNSLIIFNTWFVQQVRENKDSVRKHLVVCEVVFAACACYSFQQSCASNINKATDYSCIQNEKSTRRVPASLTIVSTVPPVILTPIYVRL